MPGQSQRVKFLPDWWKSVILLYLTDAFMNTVLRKAPKDSFRRPLYAIYLSGFAEPYEIAVFHCRAESDTDKLYAICSERIDQLKVLLLQTSYAGFADTAQICIHGKYVIMISVGEQSRSISRKIPYAVWQKG